MILPPRSAAALSAFVSIAAAVVALRVAVVLALGWGDVDHAGSLEYEYSVDVNAAPWIEFAQLPGIGETLGRRIVAEREGRGGYPSLESVNDVRGIGPSRWAAIRPYLTIKSGEPIGRRSPRPE